VVDVAAVAVEQLVGAFADLHDDRAGLAGQARHEVLRDRRPVRDRLVLVEQHLGQEVPHLLLVDEHLVMVGREPARHDPGVGELVVARVPARRGGVRPHRLVADLGHQRDVRRRVEAAGEEDPERHVGHHALADRGTEQAPDLAHHLVGTHRGDLLGDGGGRHRRPPSLDGERSVGRHDHALAGPELADPAEHRAWRGRESKRQVVAEGVLVEVARDGGVLEQGLGLRAEDEAVRQPREVQRLDAEAVASEDEPPARGIPDREGEHPLEALDACRALLLVEVDDRLGVGVGPVAMALRLELRPERRVVVDLAVVGDPDAVVLARHRLVAGRREVDDRQAPVREGDAVRAERDLARIVGAAVADCLRHPPDRARVGGEPVREAQGARDAAHVSARGSFDVAGAVRELVLHAAPVRRGRSADRREAGPRIARTGRERLHMAARVVLDGSHDPGRVPGRDAASGHVARDHAPRPDDRVVSDGHAGEDEGARADEDPSPDADRRDERVAGPELRRGVVGEDRHARRDRRLVADRYEPEEPRIEEHGPADVHVAAELESLRDHRRGLLLAAHARHDARPQPRRAARPDQPRRRAYDGL
jgi:hypothetical protein